MTAIDWSAMKTELHAWLVTGTGLAPERVLFRGQNIARPHGTGAWASIRFVGIRSDGRPAVTYRPNPTPSSGAELLRVTSQFSRVTYEATCYPPAPTDNGAAVPDASEAHALLHECVMLSGTPSRRGAFKAAGIGLLRCEPIIPMDGVVNSTRFEARAVLSFSFSVPSELLETITFIENVNISVSTSDPTLTHNFTLDLDP